ncbi:MAG: hypothetical protein KGM24_03240, partial [Elusimicrobia bacterium]|nr:hypothetical protein [Elusimicrobiota bacterium]
RRDPTLGPEALPDALSSRADLRASRGDCAGAAADLREALSTAPLDWPRRAESERLLRSCGTSDRKAVAPSREREGEKSVLKRGG